MFNIRLMYFDCHSTIVTRLCTISVAVCIMFIWLNACLCDCIHVCMVVCMFVRLYSCLCGCMHVCVVVFMFLWLYSCLCGCIHVCAVVVMFVWLFHVFGGYIYLCAALFVFLYSRFLGVLNVNIHCCCIVIYPLPSCLCVY